MGGGGGGGSLFVKLSHPWDTYVLFVAGTLFLVHLFCLRGSERGGEYEKEVLIGGRERERERGGGG